MPPLASRRHFLATVGGAAASTFVWHSGSGASPLSAASSRFKLSVITDEISQDLGHALEIATMEFGLS